MILPGMVRQGPGHSLGAAFLLLLAAPVAASQWVVLPERSSLGFTAEWNGRAIAGNFPRFQADIRFDPANLEQARVVATIDLAAATADDSTVKASLSGPDWFDVKKASVARFQSSDIRAVKPGHYVARGQLLLRGRSVPVSLPFTLSITGDMAVMNGRVTLDRRQFGIGMESDPSATWVGHGVPVRVRIHARREP